jgi:uncharacterized protein (TIGR01244 family)
MPDAVQLSDHLTVGPQPEADDFADLAARGFRTVINLRGEDEDPQPIRPAEEGTLVREQGMDYAHLHVSMKTADSALMDRVEAAVRDAPGPVYLHCRLGGRASGVGIILRGRQEGWSADRALAEGQARGITWSSEKVRALIHRDLGQ